MMQQGGLFSAGARAVEDVYDDAAAREAELDAALASRRGRQAAKAPPSAGFFSARLVKPLLAEQKISTLAQLKRQWREIAGEKLAELTFPEKLVKRPGGAVLTVRAAGSAAPFVQHQIPLLMQRCALAGAPLANIQIQQGLPPRVAPNVRPLSKPLSAAQEAELQQALASVDDPRLKNALAMLARAVNSRS